MICAGELMLRRRPESRTAYSAISAAVVCRASALMSIGRLRPHDPDEPPPFVVMAASMPARSAVICAAVDPVDVIAVAPFVIAAGRMIGSSRG